MKLDILLSPSSAFGEEATLIQHAEGLGFAGAWTTEAGRNPFFTLTIAATKSDSICLGVHAAAAFPRSPMVTAQIAWDLARQSQGRFCLGLGSGMSEDRDASLGADEQDLAKRMREYIESLRAIWDTFQNDARLRYRGEFYAFRLMAPFFNPGSISCPDIPIFLNGVNPALCSLAGELCQGLHAPILHSVSTLRDSLLPALSAGLQQAGRDRHEIQVAVPVSIVSGIDVADTLRAKNLVKLQLARQALMPANRHIVADMGWERIVTEAEQAADSRSWQAISDIVTDDALREVAIVAKPREVLGQIRERYSGLADRVCLIVTSESRQLLEAAIQTN